MLLRLLIYLSPCILIGQNHNLICGTWIEEEKKSHIEIYKNTDGVYEGKIVWLAEPKDENGIIKLDKKNPDKQQQNQPINGLIIIKNLSFIKENKWANGTIYDARSGKTYNLNATLENKNTLFLRGYFGFSLIGKTTTWKRIK